MGAGAERGRCLGKRVTADVHLIADAGEGEPDPVAIAEPAVVSLHIGRQRAQIEYRGVAIAIHSRGCSGGRRRNVIVALHRRRRARREGDGGGG